MTLKSPFQKQTTFSSASLSLVWGHAYADLSVWEGWKILQQENIFTHLVKTKSYLHNFVSKIGSKWSILCVNLFANL